MTANKAVNRRPPCGLNLQTAARFSGRLRRRCAGYQGFAGVAAGPDFVITMFDSDTRSGGVSSWTLNDRFWPKAGIAGLG